MISSIIMKKEKNCAGVWLDHRKAIIVKIDSKDESQHIEKSESHAEHTHHGTGGGGSSNPQSMR